MNAGGVVRPLEVGRVFEGARLVVVGGTGFLGKVWLAMLLHRYPQVGRIYLVVRPKSGQSPDERFWGEIVASRPFDALRDERGAGFDAFVRGKVEPVDADVTRPLCGFSAEAVRELAGTVDALVNVAGVVDFNPPLDEALLANAFGVQSLVALARELGDVPVFHTSTAYVAGYRAGDIDERDPLEVPFPKHGELEAVHWDPAREIAECLDLVEQARRRQEDSFRQSAFLDDAKKRLIARGEPARGSALAAELASVRRRFLSDALVREGAERARYWGFTNIYTYTKSIGEQILAASGLPYTIVRPSVIESSIAYPFAGWNEGINTMAPLVYLLMNGHLQVPRGARTDLDVVPVDMVAGGMIAALAGLLEGGGPKVAHLCSSDVNPVSVDRIVELIGLYKRKHYLRTGKGNPFVNHVVARFEPVTVSKDEFYRYGAPAVAGVARGLSAALRAVAVGPAASVAKPASKALDAYAGVARRNGEIWELYLPFIAETEYRFVCGAVRSLVARMNDADRDRVNWRPEGIDWRHYMHEVHIPGLERWVVPQIDEKAARPARALRGHDSLLAMLDGLVARHDLAVALARFEREGFTGVSFRELRAGAERVAARLAARGVRPGERVVIGGKNHPDWPVAYFGILRAGATAVPVDPALDEASLTAIVRASGARFALFDKPLAEGAGGAAAASLEVAVLDLAEASAEGLPVAPPEIEPPTSSTVASVLYTSGTTGEPKGVMLTHGNFTSLVASLAPLFPLTPRDRTLSVLPLHHAFEFTCGLLLPLSRGARVVYLDELTGERLSEALKASRATAMVGVPAVWQMIERRVLAEAAARGPAAKAAFDAALLVNRLLAGKLGLDAGKLLFGSVHSALGGNVRYLISGGAALPAATARVFAGLGLPLAEGYGLTEAAPVLTVGRPTANSRAGEVGKPVAGVEIAIGSPNAEGVGEVLARGPNVMAGYAGDPEASARAIDAEGWLHTGDLGKLDRRGRLVLFGREKDVVVGANGENIYPDDFEQRLGAVEGVREFGAVGIADAGGGERLALVAVVEVSDDADAGARAEAKTLARRSLGEAIGRLPASMRPAVVVVSEDPLPRTAVRKVKRAALRETAERLAAQTSPPAVERASSYASSARAAVAAVARRRPSELHAGTRLGADLGFDSLMRMELVAALEASEKGAVAADKIAAAETVGEVEAALGIVTAAEPSGAGASPEAPVVTLPAPVRDAAKSAVGVLQDAFYGKVMKPRVYGRAFIPHNRPTIVVANHASHLDMGLVRYALGSYGERLVALAARDYFFEKDARLRALVENFTDLAPIDRHAGLRETLRDVGALLDAGKTVLIFPEGTRSPDGAVHEFKGAVGHLALKHEIDVLPVYLGGTFAAMPRTAFFPTRRDVVARIGPPLSVAELRRLTATLKPASAARRVARLAQRAVEALRDGGALDLSRIEVADDAPRAHPLVTLFDELGRRFKPGAVAESVCFYFTLGADDHAKWTVRVGPTTCDVTLGKPSGGSADCVLKTSAEMFTRIVREGYQPGVPEFISGAIKSNDVSLLETFQKAFQLG